MQETILNPSLNVTFGSVQTDLDKYDSQMKFITKFGISLLLVLGANNGIHSQGDILHQTVVNPHDQSYNMGTRITSNLNGTEENVMVMKSQGFSNPDNLRLIKGTIVRENFVVRELVANNEPDEKMELLITNNPFEKGRVIKSSIKRGFL